MKIVAIFFVLIIASCSVKIKNFDKYSKTPLLELEDMPTKDKMKNTMPRVLITKADTDSDEVKKSNAPTLVAKDITMLLQEGKFANVIERKHSDLAMQEAKISELSGKGSVDSDAIDYILDVNIANVTFSRQNIATTTPIATQRGLEFGTREVYQYTSAVDGVVKILMLPKMDIVETITLKGSYTESEKATAGGTTFEADGFAIQNSNIIASKNYDSNVIYKAIKNAVQNAEQPIKKFFKKSGYILEKRVLKKSYIFGINVGSKQGVSPQSKVVIQRDTTIHNPLTDEDEMTQETICNGIVADKVFENRSWIIFDEKCQDKIRLGDKVDVVY